jgi:chromate reductase, NAD(P)H dehydrogenase (quinone)
MPDIRIWSRPIRLAPPNLSLSIIEIGALAFYSEDLEATPPEAWTAFRQSVAASQAVLFVTPEYNRSVPAVLKNALDVGSRPYGKSVWDGKPGAVVSISPGAQGAFGANHHLRQSLVFLNVLPLQQPEAYMGGAATMFDESGEFANASARDYMHSFLTAFARWIENNVDDKSQS